MLSETRGQDCKNYLMNLAYVASFSKYVDLTICM